MKQQLLAFRKKLGNTEMYPTPIGIGTCVADPMKRFGELPPLKERIDRMHYAISNGINYIDTAPAYRVSYDGYDGQKEIGEVFALEPTFREAVYVTTKGHPPDAWETDPEKNRDLLLASFDNSLKLLQTDYVDGYLLHEVGVVKEHPQAISRCIEEIQRLKEEGVIRHAIGVGTADIDVADVVLDQDWLDILQVGSRFRLENKQLIEHFPRFKAKGIAFINCQIFCGLHSNSWDPENALGFHETQLAYSVGSTTVDVTVLGMLTPKEIDKNIATAYYMSVQKARWQSDNQTLNDLHSRQIHA